MSELYETHEREIRHFARFIACVLAVSDLVTIWVGFELLLQPLLQPTPITFVAVSDLFTLGFLAAGQVVLLPTIFELYHFEK